MDRPRSSLDSRERCDQPMALNFNRFVRPTLDRKRERLPSCYEVAVIVCKLRRRAYCRKRGSDLTGIPPWGSHVCRWVHEDEAVSHLSELHRSPLSPLDGD